MDKLIEIRNQEKMCREHAQWDLERRDFWSAKAEEWKQCALDEIAFHFLEQFPPDVNLFVHGGFPSCSKSDSVFVTIRGEDDHGKGLFDRLESSCGGFGRGRRELPGSRAPP